VNIIFPVIIGSALGAATLLISAWMARGVYREWQARQRYRQDITPVKSPHRCGRCRGIATELRRDPLSAQMVCKDSVTCEETMRFKKMLDSMA